MKQVTPILKNYSLHIPYYLLETPFKHLGFKLLHPSVKVFHDLKIVKNRNASSEKEHYSQVFQDYFIYEHFFQYLDKSYQGFFCEIGANHPITHNNSLFFEKKGWKGIAFEPLPYFKPLWEKHRGNTDFFSYAVSNKVGEIELVQVTNKKEPWHDMLSYVNDPDIYVQDRDFIDDNLEKKIISVEQIILKDFLQEKKIGKIDYLSIDVEGFEENVLDGINFNNVEINVISLENRLKPYKRYKYLKAFVEKHNFQLYARLYNLDDIYVNKNFLEKIRKLKKQPN